MYVMFPRLERLKSVGLFAKDIAKIKVGSLSPLDLRQPLMVPLSHVSLLWENMPSTESLRHVIMLQDSRLLEYLDDDLLFW
jgi:hypothetical protein